MMETYNFCLKMDNSKVPPFVYQQLGILYRLFNDNVFLTIKY